MAAWKIRALITAGSPFKLHFAGLFGLINRGADGRHPAICSEDKPDIS